MVYRYKQSLYVCIKLSCSPEKTVSVHVCTCVVHSKMHTHRHRFPLLAVQMLCSLMEMITTCAALSSINSMGVRDSERDCDRERERANKTGYD